jgi:hypothetical protein
MWLTTSGPEHTGVKRTLKEKNDKKDSSKNNKKFWEN